MSLMNLLIRTKRKENLLPTLRRKKIKTPPSPGTNAADIDFPSHLFSYTTYSDLFKNTKRYLKKKKERELEKGKHPVFHLNSTAPASKSPYRK